MKTLLLFCFILHNRGRLDLFLIWWWLSRLSHVLLYRRIRVSCRVCWVRWSVCLCGLSPPDHDVVWIDWSPGETETNPVRNTGAWDRIRPRFKINHKHTRHTPAVLTGSCRSGWRWAEIRRSMGPEFWTIGPSVPESEKSNQSKISKISVWSVLFYCALCVHTKNSGWE